MTALNRREFLMRTACMTTAGSAVLSTVAGCATGTVANSKLNIALIGSGGWIAKHAWQGCGTENLVACCDVDRAPRTTNNLAEFGYEGRLYRDFRVMLEELGDAIDAAVISTPDHTHFAATMACIERGIHVYTQKPLTHTIWEARMLKKAAHEHGVVTQMGNQSHASEGIRLAVEWYRAGLIGDIREVHAWNSGPNFPAGTHFATVDAYPPPPAPVPETLAWDLWLGPAARRPYAPAYLPQTWRTFWDFGSGILGDWGCHTLDMPVWALDLDAPTVVEPISREDSLDGVVPDASVLRYHFPANGTRGPVTMTWHDGMDNGFPAPVIKAFDIGELRGAGSILVGQNGAIQCPGHPTSARPLPDARRAMVRDLKIDDPIPRVPGGSFQEWIRAIKGSGPTPGSNFDYAAKLTEIVLLGALAQRFNTRIEWDADAMAITNHPELNAFVGQSARDGWMWPGDG